MKTIITKDARDAIAIGRQNHWRFRVVQETDGWIYDHTKAPLVVQERLETLRRSGVQFGEVIIAHEAPKVLPAPSVHRKIQIAPILSGLAKVLGMTAVLAAVAGFVAVAAPILLLGAVILIDPAVIVVLEDGTWLEVMTWYE